MAKVMLRGWSVGCAMVSVVLSASAANGSELAGNDLDTALASACSVSLVPVDASVEWRRAVEELRAHLRGAATSDCASIEVHVTLSGALVAFATSDGRQAIRRVDQPSELVATTDALMVTIPPSPPPVDDAPELHAAATSTSKDVATTITSPTVAADPFILELSLFTGLRTAFPHRFTSPVLGVGIGGHVNRWHLGVYGQWETSYSSPDGNVLPKGFQMNALGVGVSVGRWIRLSESVDGVVESRLGVAVVAQEGSEAIGEVGGDTAEARVGLAFGVALPSTSHVRVRSMLGADLAVTRLRGRASFNGLPAPPTWGAALTIAMEGDAL